MLSFEQTERALADIDANSVQIFGSHNGAQVKVGHFGCNIGDVPFDPAIHDPADINPLSIWAPIVGTPQATLRMPERPLVATIITEHNAMADDPRIGRAKKQLAVTLKQAIESSMPGLTDRVHSYHIGDDDTELVDLYTEVVADGKDELAAAQTAAELCREGLAFVISDFNSLPLHKAAELTYPATIAVKLSHPADMGFPQQKLPLRLGGLRELGKKPKEIRQENAKLARYHEYVKGCFENVGIALAQVVYDPKSRTEGGLNSAVADEAIASAIVQVAED